jgi:hypothetical protein
MIGIMEIINLKAYVPFLINSGSSSNIPIIKLGKSSPSKVPTVANIVVTIIDNFTTSFTLSNLLAP